MKQIKNNKKGFTLVELLAVIVILAIILVIAVPKVMSVIEDSKKATLESTAKMIASAAEKQKVQNTVLGKTDTITCDSVAKINKLDYEDCDIDFDDNTAKVTIKGKGKFAGLNICNGTKTNATATSEGCVPAPVSFSTDSWKTIVTAVKQAYKNGTEYPYNVGDEKTIDMDVEGNGTTLGTHKIRVANKTKCNALQTQILSKSACGFVLEFADIITTHTMNGIDNASSTNAGGWPVSEIWAYVNSTIYNALPEKLKKGIIDTYVVSSHGDEDMTEYENVVEGNFYSTDKLYLLSTYEVWGSNPGGYDTSATDTITRQLDYYAEYKGVDSNGVEYTGVSTSNYEGAIKKNNNTGDWYWLRSARYNRNNSFFAVDGKGDWYSINSSSGGAGVSPAFRLGE